MSDDTNKSTEAASLTEQMDFAKSKEGAATMGNVGASGEAVDVLADHVRQFIANSNSSSRERALALTKLDEMVFWIRAGYGRG